MRRKVPIIVLVAGAVLVGGTLFTSVEKGPVPVEIHYLLPPDVAAMEVIVTRPGGGPAVATFESEGGTEVVSRTRLPAGENALAITLVSASGTRRTAYRALDVRRGAVVRIDLRRESP